jgi:ATP synthase protein I
MSFNRQPRPFRTVLRWQVIAVGVLTSAAALLWGSHGAISAALGGGINVVAGWVYGWRVAQADAQSVGDTLRTLFRAWAYKLVLIVGLMWMVLTQYREVVHAAFFLAFVITVGVFSAAVAVTDTK